MDDFLSQFAPVEPIARTGKSDRKRQWALVCKLYLLALLKGQQVTQKDLAKALFYHTVNGVGTLTGNGFTSATNTEEAGYPEGLKLDLQGDKLAARRYNVLRFRDHAQQNGWYAEFQGVVAKVLTEAGITKEEFADRVAELQA